MRDDCPMRSIEVSGPKGRTLGLALLLFASLPVPARTVAAQPPGQPAQTKEQHKWYILGRVTTLAGIPLPGTEVEVHMDAGPTLAKLLRANFQGEFEISLDADPNKSHRLKLVAKREGYLAAKETVDFISDSKADVVELLLREDKEDVNQIPLETLISSVAERLRASAGTSLAEPGRCDVLRGAQAFLNAHDADVTLPLLAEAVEREPKCVECRTLLGLAMVKEGSWSSATRQLSEAAALNSSLEVKNRRSEPNLVLGVLECWRENPQRATELFLQALDSDPTYPLLLQELGRAYLLQQNWSEADKYLARAIEAGASPEARLFRAQAFLGELKPGEAHAEIQAYLGKRKPKDLPARTRMLWIQMNYRMELEFESAESVSRSVVNQNLAELSQALPELKELEPANGQEELTSILQKVGERVEAFFRDFHNTISQEQIRQELLRREGGVSASSSQNFQYLLTTWPDKARPGLEEYRTDRKGARTYPGGSGEGFMLTSGFASQAQFFLPAYQQESQFAYLGRQRIDGHENYVVAFAQRPEVARLLASFRASGTLALTLSQGVAWIDCGTYQINRLRTDLLCPLAKARLDRETTEIRYAEVHFKDAPLSLWLPREVVVTVEWKGKLRRNRHTYSDFHLFSVESKINVSPEPLEGP